MSQEGTTVWADELVRLISARDRYRSSLNAIQDITKFAIERLTELDSNLGIILRIGGPKTKEIEHGEEAAIALAELLTGFLEKLRGNPDLRRKLSVAASDNESDSENKAEAEAIDRPVSAEFSPLLDEFASSFPEDFDLSQLSKILQTDKQRTRADLLLSSLLTAAISDFEVLFAAIVRFFYRVKPEALREQDAPIPWSEIELYATIEDLKTYYIEERVNKLMWQGFDDWMRWFEKQFKTRYVDISLNPDETNEVFQRRHVILHNGGLVSRQYLAKVKGQEKPPPLGTELKVDQDYLAKAIDRLTVLGVSLTDATARRLCRERDQCGYLDSDIQDVIYNLLLEERWRPAERIAEITMSSMVSEYPRVVVQVNKWIALKRRLGADAIRDEVLNWDVSALQKKFQLARLVLLDDASTVSTAKQMVADGEITNTEVAEWPLFSEIKKRILESTLIDGGPQNTNGSSTGEIERTTPEE